GSFLAIGAIGFGFVLFWFVLRDLLVNGPGVFNRTWFEAGGTSLKLGMIVDPLSVLMMGIVTFVALGVQVYSLGYMRGDPRFGWYFAVHSLFAAAMLGLVLANNLLLLYISWELVGLCSYLLIGFWYERRSAAEAAKKAFVTTRIGDVGLLIGIIMLWRATGTFDMGEIFEAAEAGVMSDPYLTAAVILIFAGAVGKSAQFPLHVWLPDAMEGPTPVSALIHAATMVSAGIFLIARIFPLLKMVVDLEGHNPTLGVIAFIGAFTALFSSTIAIAQDDIKRVLAFSTISQLGYMVGALGIGGFVAGTFHLITHAFFKALLFLGSGSVIVGCHHEMDMMEMGGLRDKMPKTFWTFLAGTLALAGFPLTAGFWSKDEILGHAFDEFLHEGVVSWPFYVWLLLTLAAFVTAFYMGRQVCLTFLGKPRGHGAEHAHETPNSMTYPLIALALFALFLGFMGVPEEFPVLGPLFGHNWFHHFIGHGLPSTPLNWMVMGLSSLLAIGGLFLGWVVYGRVPLAAGEKDPLERAMQKVGLGWLYEAMRRRFYFDELYQATFVRGTIALADVFFKFDNRWVIDPIVNLVGRIARFIADVSAAFDLRIIDGLVDLAGRAGAALSSLSGILDLNVVDRIVDGVGQTARAGGRSLRRIQTGRVQNYLLVALVTVLMLLGLYIVYW
ncbi:MAG: NADH-quinone oxidoreductase subunit L, partial [Anaerolineae bacterium]